jgi:GNAT superfamily N-acetyltransferase
MPDTEAELTIECTTVTANDLERLRTIAIESYAAFYAYLWQPKAMENYLAKAFRREQLETEISAPNVVYKIARRAGADAGYLKWHRLENLGTLTNAAYLERVYVLPSAAGRRVGTRLIEDAIHDARTAGRTSMWLRAMANQHAVVDRYRALGFEVIDHTELVEPGVRPEHAAMIVMSRTL